MEARENQYLNKISDNIFLVSTPMNGQFPYCYSFLFTGNENILIDAGTDKDILKAIDKETGIDTLVISHSHPDHIRSWDALSHRKLLFPVETPDSVFNLELLGERYMGTRENGLHWVRSIAKMLALKEFRQPDDRFSDGYIFDNGKTLIEAIHAPGHLDDHYCFFEHNSAILFTTDIDFSSFGPWYGNPEGKIKLFRESIEKVMSLPYSRLCSSHRLPREGDMTEMFRIFLDGFDRQKNKILDLTRTGKALNEIVSMSPFYNHKFIDTVIQNVFEENMSVKILAILIDEGLVYEKNGLYISS